MCNVINNINNKKKGLLNKEKKSGSNTAAHMIIEEKIKG